MMMMIMMLLLMMMMMMMMMMHFNIFGWENSFYINFEYKYFNR